MADEERTTNGLLRYRVDEVEKKLNALEEKIDRLTMSMVVASFTCAGAILLLALNLLVMIRGR